MSRQRLPDRRECVIQSIDFEGIAIDFSIGLAADGSPKEVFARLRKPGSTLDRLIDDATTIISLALQSGLTIREMEHSLGRLSGGGRSSALGVIVDAMAAEVTHD